MNTKNLLTSVGVVVAGVMLAGWLMNQLRSNELVNDAIAGFDH